MSQARLSQFVPRLPGRKTGIQNPNCYAAPLQNCSVATSREHYISHGLLKKLSQDGITIEMEGVPWLKDDERKKFATKSLVSNILCRRHNEALSGLDSVAQRFFLSIDKIDKSFNSRHHSDHNISFHFNGHDIERWILKTLCGLVCSGITSSHSGPIKGWKPSLQWLQILFGKEPLAKGWGLYTLGTMQHVSVINRTFQCAPISNENLGIYGAVIVVNDKKFILAMRTPSANRNDTLLAGFLYRPDQLVMTGGTYRNVIQLLWDVPGEGGSSVIHYRP